MWAWWCCTSATGREEASLGPSFRLVARVRIGGQPRRPDAVQAGELTGRAFEGRPRLDAAHVADVLAHEGVLARGEAERVLQLTPDRQRRTRREREPERHGGVAPGTPQRQLAPAVRVDLEHGVVARDVDGSVVQQPRVGDASQPSPGVVVLVADRLVGQVATRHDQHVGHRGPDPAPGPERRADDAAACRGAAHPTGDCPGPPTPRWPTSAGPVRRRRRTMGRWADVRRAASDGSTRASVRATSRSRAMTANGFSKRCFRSRSRCTAASEAASQARWYPPRPLMATISPARERRLGGRDGRVRADDRI